MATDVSASLPELVLAPGATITVTCDDPAALITELNVYGFSPTVEAPEESQIVAPLFTYAAG